MRTAMGCELLLFGPLTEPTLRVRLGKHPRRRLSALCGSWLLSMLVLGAALRMGHHPEPVPALLQWARTQARVAAALRLPGWTKAPALPPSSTDGDDEDAAARAERLELGSRPVASTLLRGEVDPRWRAEAERLGDTPRSFLWPVRTGWFVRGFGSGEGGYHLAVDVAGEQGSTVRASADGIVAYAGSEVRGYGNLILIVHGGGFVTMYAHNESHSVAPGDFVRRGDPIASLGSTGISRGPHVHYELIHDHQNCDPVPLFAPGVRHRYKGFVEGRQVEWVDRKPRRVRCDRRRRHPRSRWVHSHDESQELDHPNE